MNCPRLVAKQNANTDPSLIVLVEQLEEGSGTLCILGRDGGTDCEVSWQSRVVDLPFPKQERKAQVGKSGSAAIVESVCNPKQDSSNTCASTL